MIVSAILSLIPVSQMNRIFSRITAFGYPGQVPCSDDFLLQFVKLCLRILKKIIFDWAFDKSHPYSKRKNSTPDKPEENIGDDHHLN